MQIHPEVRDSNEQEQTRRPLLSNLACAALLGVALPSSLKGSPASQKPELGGEMTITRINHFSAKPGSGNELYDLINSFLPYIRESDGCIDAQNLRGVDDTDQIVVIEVWRNQEAHRASAANVPDGTFPKAMALMSGPPTGAYYQ